MGTNYIIREAIDSDFQQILSIYRYCWDDYFKNTPADYEQVLKYLKEAFDNRQGYFNFWVCDNGEGEIFGWQSCLQVFNSPLRKGYNGELSTYIRQDKQNGIIAARLCKKVVNEILKNSPLLILWTHIDPSNTASQRLAIHWGFIKIADVTNSPYYQINEVWQMPLKEFRIKPTK